MTACHIASIYLIHEIHKQLRTLRVYIYIRLPTFAIISSLSVLCSSLELRELEARLKAGYMNKERAAQIAEKNVLKTKDEVTPKSRPLVTLGS